MRTEAHGSAKPEELCYNTLMTPNTGNTAEVWIRRNIRQQEVFAPSNEDEPTQEWVYDEVYFQTTADRAEIEANIDRYWELGSDWSPAVPMTDKEMIAKLQEELQEAKADLTQARTDSDMAIAELTIVLATMMAPTVQKEGGVDMFDEYSQLTKTWVRLVKSGAYGREDVPNLSNLREVVWSVLDRAEKRKDE